jgi:N-acyl-D-aspartate/D-glutamate deacylase
MPTLMFDLLIHGATLIDGTGSPARTADVGVRDGAIAAVGQLGATAAADRVIDGTALVLAPGFIDIHTHSDLHLLHDGAGESKLLQGVTTEVTGNCSFAPFPIEPERLELHRDHLARATAHTDLTWTDLDGYAQALAANGLGINVAPLAGHGTLRVAALGTDQRPPTPDELGRMRRDLTIALDQGAWGMSTGLTHVPSAYGAFDEIVALARVLASRGALYATHARGPNGIGESIDLGRESGVSVEHSHMAINNPAHWGTADRQLAQLEQARATGIDIVCDVYPYIASSSSLTQHLPLWVQSGGTEAMRRRMSDPAARKRALQDMTEGWFTGNGIPFLWDRFMIADTPDGYGIARTIEDLAAEAGADPYEFTLALCERYGNAVRVVIFYRDERDVEAFLAHPLSVVGSDGNAVPMEQGRARIHPRSFGTFPRVLGRYVRERRTLGLEQAIRKMSGETARRLGMRDRGTIAEGKAADLVLFDPRSVADTADFGAAPTPPVGMELVVVNGVVMVEHGAITSERRPGRVLLRTG